MARSTGAHLCGVAWALALQHPRHAAGEAVAAALSKAGWMADGVDPNKRQVRPDFREHTLAFNGYSIVGPGVEDPVDIPDPKMGTKVWREGARSMQLFASSSILARQQPPIQVVHSLTWTAVSEGHGGLPRAAEPRIAA